MNSQPSPSLVEVTDASLAYICLGGFVVAFSMMSLVAREKLYINEVILGTAFGVLMGPHVANVFNPRSWTQSSLFLDRITLEVTRLTLATGLFAIGVELPKSYMYDHAKSLLTMVVPTMAIGWLIVSGLLKALFPKFGFVACLAIASCLTPTDPIISAAIVGGEFARRHVPENLRMLILAESAANDGLAYPFLTFAIYLTVDRTAKDGVKDWVLIGVLYQVVMGTVLGALLGYGFSKFMKLAHKMGWIDRQSYVAQYLALSTFIAGFVSTIGSDDLLAAFAAGCAISWDGDFNERTKGELFGTVIDLVFNCGCFIYIGAWLSFETFNMPNLGITPWRLTILCVGILVLRRIPALLILFKWIPEIQNWKEALFTGHFGPMGVGAVFVSTLALHKLPVPTYPPETQEDLLALTLQPIVTFVVLGSIIIHGLSIPFFNAGKNMKSRTLTFARSLTAHRTMSRPAYPEWLNQITGGFSSPMTSPEADTAPQDPPLDNQPKKHVQVHVRSLDDDGTVEASSTDSDTRSLPVGSACSLNPVGAVDADTSTGVATGAKLPGGALTSIQRLSSASNGSSPSVEIETVQRSQVNLASIG